MSKLSRLLSKEVKQMKFETQLNVYSNILGNFELKASMSFTIGMIENDTGLLLKVVDKYDCFVLSPWKNTGWA